MSTEEQLQEMDRREMTEKTELSRIIENSNIDEGDKKRVIARIHTEEFRGPIPHPQILRQYDEIQPGLAEKIVGMALREQEHRHEMDSALVKSEVSLDSGKLEIIRASIKMKSRLQLFGFLSTTVLVCIGAVCIFLDKNAESFWPFVLAIGSFCGTMFYGKKGEGKENPEENAKEEG